MLFSCWRYEPYGCRPCRYCSVMFRCLFCPSLSRQSLWRHRKIVPSTCIDASAADDRQETRCSVAGDAKIASSCKLDTRQVPLPSERRSFWMRTEVLVKFLEAKFARRFAVRLQFYGLNMYSILCTADLRAALCAIVGRGFSP